MKRSSRHIKPLFLACCLALATVATPPVSMAAGGGGTTHQTHTRAGALSAAACGVAAFFAPMAPMALPAAILFCGFALLDGLLTPD